MYQEFYGLTDAPFDITPNPRFLFYSAKHREAFNHLLYGIRERKGFVQLTGEVGAGKSTLCRAALEQLDQHYTTALILNPVMSANELMQAIAMEYGLPVNGLDRLNTVGVINNFLLQQVERGELGAGEAVGGDILSEHALGSVNGHDDVQSTLPGFLPGEPPLRPRQRDDEQGGGGDQTGPGESSPRQRNTGGQGCQKPRFDELRHQPLLPAPGPPKKRG